MPETLLDYRQPQTPQGVSGPRGRAGHWLAVRWVAVTVDLIVTGAVSFLLGLMLVPSDMIGWRVALVAGSWLPLAIALFALASGLGWVSGRLIGNNYKTLLIGRYLWRRRIAWVSLIAVTLCTTMVLVVISVMGGWLDMFEASARGLSADLVIRTGSLAGFSGYETMIDRFQKELPEVSAAVPTLETFGLLNINHVKPITVQVMGWPIEQIGRVNKFPESLYRQHVSLVDRLAEIAEARQKLVRDSKMSSAEIARWCTFFAWWLDFAAVGLLFGWSIHRSKSRFVLAVAAFIVLGVPVLAVTARLTWRHYAQPHSQQALADAQELAELDRETARINDELRKPPAYDLNDAVSQAVEVPDDLKLADANKGLLNTGDKALDQKVRLGWGSQGRALYSRGPLSDDETDKLRLLSESKSWGKAVTELARKSHWPGMIASTGVVEIRMGPDGKLVGREPFKHHLEATLMVLGVSADGQVDPNNRADRNYWIIDDSHTGMWQYDMDTVYVPFDELQKDLGMGASQATSRVTGQVYTEPARTSEIHIKLKPGADPDAVKPKAQKIVDDVLGQGSGAEEMIDNVRVETWRESGAKYIDAILHEKVLVVFLFTIISVVAIFLIFCIFYMIVAEKTKDIGIIKSVGATNAGVAGVFLGYGLVIGLIGGGMGLLCSYGIIHNINELHALMGKLMHIRIWSPEVYAFDKIPNTMDPMETAVIVSIAVLSSVLGALIPAIRAARMNPVDALRWE